MLFETPWAFGAKPHGHPPLTRPPGGPGPWAKLQGTRSPGDPYRPRFPGPRWQEPLGLSPEAPVVDWPKIHFLMEPKMGPVQNRRDPI